MLIFYRRTLVSLALPLPALLSAALPSDATAQSNSTGSGPYTTQPYLQGPTRPLDGTPRSGVYSSRPAPAYDTTRGNLSTARAAPYAPPAIWNGLYVGVQAGHRWSRTAVDGWNTPATSQGNWLAGAFVGTNKQFGNFVVGLEGDLALGSVTNTTSVSGASLMMRDSWTSTVRARGGVAFGQALIYATAGVAMTDHKLTLSSSAPTMTANDVKFGSVIGAGVEYRIAPRISTRIEALHYDFKDSNLNWTSGGVKQDSNVLRAGVSFQFN